MRRRSVRLLEGAFVMEGEKLLSVALDAGAEVECVFVAPEVAVPSEPAGAPGVREVSAPATGAAGAESEAASAGLLRRAEARGVRVFELAPGVLERVADTVTPQPVLGIVRIPRATLADLALARFVVVCVDVRDPGNTGAVIRAADAAGADGVVCCEGTVDPFNPKTVRASAGSVLHLPVVAEGTPEVVLEELGRLGLRRLAAVAHGGASYTEVDLAPPVALVLGNEAAGLSEDVAGRLDGRVTVPLAGGAESLNVSMAAAVLCFEVARRRSNLHRDECEVP